MDNYICPTTTETVHRDRQAYLDSVGELSTIRDNDIERSMFCVIFTRNQACGMQHWHHCGQSNCDTDHSQYPTRRCCISPGGLLVVDRFRPGALYTQTYTHYACKFIETVQNVDGKWSQIRPDRLHETLSWCLRDNLVCEDCCAVGLS